MRHDAARILRYEIFNLLRSRWLIAFGATMFVTTEAMFRFGGDTAKVVTSLLNVVLIVVPLISSVLGTIHSYNSREFNELLLTQPVNRSSIYLGKLTGFAVSLCVAFVVGLGIPFLLHGQQLAAYAAKAGTLLAVGCGLIVVFAALAFFVATRYDDRIKGLGIMLVAWFLLTILYDGLILLYIHTFSDYPYEGGLLALVFMNPVDLGRIAILLQLEISALMGYTGAMFRNAFGAGHGMALATAAMVVYAAIPVFLGLRAFGRKDL